MTGECEICAAPLGAHNITRLCAECKLVARNRRLSPTYDDTGLTLVGECQDN